jgi:hypothetical protein
MDRGILVGLAMILGGALVGIANLKWRARKVQNGRSDPRAKALPLLASREIKYYSGAPAGYVGYTDYTAMNVDVNDSLIGRSAEEQFTLVGFGEGFSAAMLERAAKDGLSQGCIFRIDPASEQEMNALAGSQ